VPFIVRLQRRADLVVLPVVSRPRVLCSYPRHPALPHAVGLSLAVAEAAGEAVRRA